MNWSKSYIFAGSRLLSTITKSGSSELTEYHHPDRLGTKLVTDTTANTAKSQSTLPFGTEITAETQATTNQKFTSYDRSGATGLDYAVNRTYNPGQSRFTQVDPIGMGDSSLGSPQSMNLFAYTRNNPVDYVDPSGLNLAGPFTGSPACYLDGFEVSCGLAYSALSSGWAELWTGGTVSVTAYSDNDKDGKPDEGGFLGYASYRLYGFNVREFFPTQENRYDEPLGPPIRTEKDKERERQKKRKKLAEKQRKDRNDADCNSPTLDISGGIFAIVGGQVGVQLNGGKVRFYSGFGFGLKGVGGSVSATKKPPAGSAWHNFQGGALLGYSGSQDLIPRPKKKGIDNGWAIMTPGAAYTINGATRSFSYPGRNCN